MRKIKKFNEFIGESKSLAYLQNLGLIGRNERFFTDLEQIIEMCPNLNYVTYPSSSVGNMSRKIEMKTPEKLYQLTIWMNVKGKISDDELKEYKRLRDKGKYDQMHQYLEDVAKRIYGEAEVAELQASMEDGVKQEFKEELDKMMQHLRSIDQESEVEFRIWGIDQAYPARGETRVQIPYSLRKHDAYDTQGIVEFLQANPEAQAKIDRLQIAATSEKHRDFAKRMSAGEFGSLD
jgi:hypothetical protein